MSLSFKTFSCGNPSDCRMEATLRKEMQEDESRLENCLSWIRGAAPVMSTLKSGKKILQVTGDLDMVRELARCRDVIGTESITPHQGYTRLVCSISDYAKRVSDFASDAIKSVKRYTLNLFELFIRKVRLSKNIDTTKYQKIDSTLRMTVMNFGDFTKFESVFVRDHAAVVDDLKLLNAMHESIVKQIESHVEAKRILNDVDAAVEKMHMTQFLLEENLITLPTTVDPSGFMVVSHVLGTDRFNELEKSSTLQDAGWDSVIKIQQCRLLRGAEEITYDLNGMYKQTIDFMDDMRRIADKYTETAPDVCVNLVRYSNVVAQIVNAYTKVFDMCWNTALRVTNACS